METKTILTQKSFFYVTLSFKYFLESNRTEIVACIRYTYSKIIIMISMR